MTIVRIACFIWVFGMTWIFFQEVGRGTGNAFLNLMVFTVPAGIFWAYMEKMNKKINANNAKFDAEENEAEEDIALSAQSDGFQIGAVSRKAEYLKHLGRREHVAFLNNQLQGDQAGAHNTRELEAKVDQLNKMNPLDDIPDTSIKSKVSQSIISELTSNGIDMTDAMFVAFYCLGHIGAEENKYGHLTVTIMCMWQLRKELIENLSAGKEHIYYSNNSADVSTLLKLTIINMLPQAVVGSISQEERNILISIGEKNLIEYYVDD